ncbi:hypothetical protein CsatB_028271 [Cannabis sativa]
MEIDTESENPNNGFDYSNSAALQWNQWQLLDSILPTGGFAHSLGLEAAIQSHLVSTPQHLETFISHLLDNTGSLLLPYVYSAAISPDGQTWHKLDKMLDVTLTNQVGRKASTAQGSALMRVAASVYSETQPCLKIMRDASLCSASGKVLVCFHHAPIFGLVCGVLGMDSTTAQRAYMYTTTRDVISAATRLNLVGPLAAAVLQHRMAKVAEALVLKWMNRSVEDSCQIAPLLDTVQGCHPYLFSRLFCS